jgi:hypothetical protein
VTGNTKNLRELFTALQDKLACSLGAARVFDHPTAKGDASEFDWIGMFCEYLPERYSARKAFVIDSEGNSSDQLDIVIFDRFYSSVLFSHRGGLYIPSESVYAVFEVKQDFSKANLDYASIKAASVRRLKQTSTPMVSAGTNVSPRKPLRPLAGILSFGSDWVRDLQPNLFKVLSAHDQEARLDLGCAITSGAFEFKYTGQVNPTMQALQIISRDISLAFFLLTLLQRLRELGTVPAIDWQRYFENAAQH